MDRNTILALALAMLVLSLYQSIFVVPKKMQELKNTQVIQNKEDIKKEPVASPAPAEEINKTTETSRKEEITGLETPNLSVEFSNLGGALHKVVFSGTEKTFPFGNVASIQGLEEVPFILTEHTNENIAYSYSDAKWKVVKTFHIADPHSIKANIQITNLSSSRLENVKFTAIDIDSQKVDVKSDRGIMLYEFSILENNKIYRKGNAYKFGPKDNKSNAGDIGWVGYRTHYHAFLIKPEFETKGYENQVLAEHHMVSLIQPKNTIAPGQTVNYEFTIVAGNQNIAWLKTYHKNLEKIVAFSSFWIIDIFAKGVYYAIPMIHTVCRSWGLSIILISLIIYGLTYPLTMKSMSSMRKMQLVQPKIAALQKKHKEDHQKLNSEMIELYRKEGINPLGGCLPYLLQMPIFMALYQILWRAYYFQGQSFLWIKDLSLPDRLLILPFNLPFLGNELNILPIIMGAVMFLQQSVSSKNMVVTDDQQAMQQKMMKFIFPFFIGFIFYKFASGLSLYFTVFYALSTWTQWKISKVGATPVKN